MLKLAFRNAVFFLILYCVAYHGISAAATLRRPYTTPVIQTSHAAAADPETGATVQVLPVNFTVTVADCFAKPVKLINGTRLSGPVVIQTHVFTAAELKLVFDVPNPGLDFVMNLTSDAYPVIQDQYGGLWKPVSPLSLEVIKQDTKYTYDVGSVGMTSYQSQSEFMETPLGTPQYDSECYRTKACCGLNATNYRKYSLVDSPVPAYACTNTSVTYQPAVFHFEVASSLKFVDRAVNAACLFIDSQRTGDTVTCSGDSLFATATIQASAVFTTPSFGYALCRQGICLEDRTYELSPIPVSSEAFCVAARCIGYTSKNYMSDRLSCDATSLGYYTSLDGNNSNQFSFYEQRAATYWVTSFPGLRWIDDVGMSSASTIQNISFQRDVPTSTGWSLSYADFALPITDTLQPLFPIGRPTRLAARLNSDTNPAAIIVEVEYVLFSTFMRANWTIQTCVADVCASSRVPAARITNLYPTTIKATIPFTALGATSQHPPSEVVVTVTCETMPAAGPFHTLLDASTVAVGAAILPSATKTVDATLARKPPQNLPSPYAASMGPDATSRIICMGDYRFSSVTKTCEPLTDADCAIKYRRRRTYFNTTTRACESHVQRLTSPLKSRMLLEPLPPPPVTAEDLRKLLAAMQLPKFMQTMEQAFDEHDSKIASQEKSSSAPGVTGSLVKSMVSTAAQDGGSPKNRAPSVSQVTSSTTASTDSTTSASTPEEVPGFYQLSIFFIVVTCLVWTFIFLRDVIYKLAGVPPWPERRRKVRQLQAPPPSPASVAAQTTQAPATQDVTPPTLAHHTPDTPTANAATLPKIHQPTKEGEDDGVKKKRQVRGKKEKEGKQRSSPYSTQSAYVYRTGTPPPPAASTASAAPAPTTTGTQRPQTSNGHSHRAHGRRAARARRQAAPTWADVPLSAFQPSHFHSDADAPASEQHTPFGFVNESHEQDEFEMRDDYTRRSGSRGRHRSYSDDDRYNAAQSRFAERPQPGAWRSFSATPLHTPPTEGASWGPQNFSEGYAPNSPRYGRGHTMHDPFATPRSASTAQSRQSAQFSPFDYEEFAACTPVRQSSRVEVLSSDTDDVNGRGATTTTTTAHAAADDTRSHHVESID